MDRIETEPVLKKRESLSSLFRSSKIDRGWKSNTSFNHTSSESESLDIIEISEPSPVEQKESESTVTISESSSRHNYIAWEIEEGVHFTMTSETIEGQNTFESKPSSNTYIDSSEEFRYLDKDILPGPLNLEL